MACRCLKHYEATCKYCKKDFEVCKHRLSEVKYCSHSCRSKANLKTALGDLAVSKRIEKTCITCGGKFEVKRYRNNIAVSCSIKCQPHLQIGARTGAEVPNWKGGITPLRIMIRTHTLYKRWRTNIFERDDFTCQICGIRGVELNVDHWPKSFSQILHDNNIRSLEDAINCEEMWNIKNNRTLCADCHKFTPNYGGRGKLSFIYGH